MTTTLLGVDDSKTMRRVLEITFAGEDFRTVLAENADDAMSKLQAERPSVVLVDAGLDGSGGYELCQRLKAAAPGVGVVLLSSKQQPYDRSRGSSAGADDFIDKPFDTQQLIDKVVGLLRKGSSTSASVARPAASISAPVAAPPIQVPARPVAAAVEARPRTATLSYGSHSATPIGGSAPVAPLVPPNHALGSRPTAAAVNVRSATPAPPAFTPVAAPPPTPAPVHAPPASSAPITVAPVPSTAPPPVAPVASAAAAVVANHTANGSDLSHKLANLGLTAEQVAGVLALSREVVERVVWEVVPTLAETIIKEEIQRLTSE